MKPEFTKRLLRALPGLLLTLLLMLTVLRQANPLKIFPSLDNGYYLYTGQMILRGGTPYLDFWESKPPAIFYINALGLLLGRGTRWGVWGLEFVCLCAAVLLGFGVMRRRWGELPAWLGSFCWLLGLNAVLDGGNLTEEYALPLAFLAAWAWLGSSEQAERRRYPFLLGLAFAGGFLLRANNTGLALAGVLAWLVLAVRARDLRQLVFRLFWSGLAVLGVLGLVVLAALLRGNLQAMWQAAILFNLSLQKESQGLLPSFLSGLATIGIPAGFGLLGYALLVISPARREPFSIFLLIALPLEVALASVSGRGYLHYFMPWLPVLGLLAAWLAAGLPGLSTLPTPAVLTVLLVCATLLVPHTLVEYRDAAVRLLFARQQGVEIDHPVAAYLRENTKPAQQVLVWGGRLAFNVLSRRASPSAVLFYPLLADSPISESLAVRFASDLQARPPALIVDTCGINQDLLPCLDPARRAEQQKSGQLWKFLPANIDSVYAFIAHNYKRVSEIDGYVLYALQTH